MSRKIICSRCGKIVDVNHDCPNAYKDKRVKKWQGSRWNRIKQEVKARDGCCVLCFLNGVFSHGEHCHHIIPREVNDSDNSIYEADNCIFLCESCHHKVHETKTSWKDYIEIFQNYIKERKNGF